MCLLIAASASAQSTPRPEVTSNILREFSASVEALTQRVSPAVVQVLVTGYGAVDGTSNGGDAGLVIGRQRTMGSGAIIDSDGYIITNAHVVAGAKHVQVVLHHGASGAGPVRSLTVEDGQTVDARVVGTATDIDLALLKVDVTGLQALPLANYDAIRSCSRSAAPRDCATRSRWGSSAPSPDSQTPTAQRSMSRQTPQSTRATAAGRSSTWTVSWWG
jgi:serine protease Do